MINVEANQGAVKIKRGLKYDIEKLIEDFIQSESIRFVSFSELWREKSFIYIFTFKLNENDLREFIEEAYATVLDQLDSNVTPQKTLTLLYVLYSLYLCSPIEPKVPIKLTLPKFKAFRSLFYEARDAKHNDTCYVWLKLMSLGAFHLVAKSKPFGPLGIKRNPVSTSSSVTNSNNGSSFAHSDDLAHFIDELKGIHGTYTRLKTELEGPGVATVRDLKSVNEDLFKLYSNLVAKESPAGSNLNEPGGSDLSTTYPMDTNDDSS